MVAAATLDIGEVHERTGIQPSALRYYERRGLIEPAGRSGLRRCYEPEVIGRLALIRAAQAAGFSLTETAELLAASPSDTELRRRLAAKADELDHRVAVLTAVRDQLRHAVRCQSPRLIDCPHFKRWMRTSLTDPESHRREPGQTRPPTD
jgi:DNA-binding transcriptional MerR regulator